MESNPLTDPDLAYPTLILKFIPAGLRGIILCGLFASLMSSVDSLFHSTSTLFPIDIYKRHLKPQATDQQVVKVGRNFIWAMFLAGVFFAWINVYVKFDNPGFALTHWFNEMTFYVQNGIAF
jgi:SSS family solute:Na+ symporter